MLVQRHPEVPPRSSLCFLSSANSMQACLSVVIFVNSSMCHKKKFFETFSYQFKILTDHVYVNLASLDNKVSSKNLLRLHFHDNKNYFIKPL